MAGLMNYWKNPNMKILKTSLLYLLIMALGSSCSKVKKDKNEFEPEQMMIRIAEIEIDPIYLKEYIAILKEESEASVRLEPGVISIYPMFDKKTPTEIRILEIYANKEAYESHLQTPHFKKYKTTTLKMVKSLKLTEVEAIDKESMPRIFRKLNP